jgi:hypothetical protein
MPYKITKNGSGTFKVVAKTNPSKIYAYATKDPTALIQAIESRTQNKGEGFRKSRTQNKTKNTNVKSTKTPKPKRKKL